MQEIVRGATAGCLVYLLLVYFSYALLLIFAVVDNAVKSRDARAENFDALLESRFTIPVSVVVPVFNEEAVIENVIAALRHLRYPELELLVVDDGSTDSTVDLLNRALDLEPTVRFVRQAIETERVHEVLASRVDPRVLVIRKDNGGRADAVNCGINYARYRYVCGVDGDTLYMPHALLNTMRLVMRDPKRVVGITGHIAVATQPERLHGYAEGRVPIERRLLAMFQHMEYLRAFLNSRLAWSRFNFMFCVSGAFNIWRRDLLVELGGFSREFTCEDIEFTFRAHEHLRRSRTEYRILATPEIAARTEGPATIQTLTSQRERWQRVTLETVWHYRRMILNPRYGVLGLAGLPFFLLTEVFAPIAEVLAFATLVSAAVLGLVDWPTFFVFFASIAFANALLTSAAVLLEDISTRAYRLDHLARLIALGPAELLLYRPLLLWAHFVGAWGFLRGDRSWAKLERNARQA